MGDQVIDERWLYAMNPVHWGYGQQLLLIVIIIVTLIRFWRHK